MTDYLSDIIDRSKGGIPAIKPRLKALFEPASKGLTEGEFEIAVEREKSGSRPVIPHQEKHRPPTKKTTESPAEVKNGIMASFPAREDMAPLTEKKMTRQEAVVYPVYTQQTAATAKTERPAGKTVTPETVIVRTVPNLVPEYSSKETLRSPETGAAPVVRVSIGRVEVRAVLPQAPVSPRKPARQNKPLLTLDNYLKQRQERKT